MNATKILPKKKKNASHRHRGEYEPEKSTLYQYELEYHPKDALWELRAYGKCACGETVVVYRESLYGIKILNDMPFGIPDSIEYDNFSLGKTKLPVNGMMPIVIRFSLGV